MDRTAEIRRLAVRLATYIANAKAYLARHPEEATSSSAPTRAPADERAARQAGVRHELLILRTGISRIRDFVKPPVADAAAPSQLVDLSAPPLPSYRADSSRDAGLLQLLADDPDEIFFDAEEVEEAPTSYPAAAGRRQGQPGYQCHRCQPAVPGRSSGASAGRPICRRQGSSAALRHLC